MRIRNRSCSAVLSSRGSCEKKAAEVEDGEDKFLLPLVAAAMDSQQRQEDEHQIDGTIPGSATGIEWRRGNKWRDILLRCTTGNAKSCETIKVDSWEAGKTKLKGKKIMRNKGDKLGFLEDEGENRGVVEKKNRSGRCVKAGTTSDYRKYDSPKLGQFESDFMSRKHHEHLVENGDVYTIDISKRRRTKKNRDSCDDIDYIDPWKSGDKTSCTISKKEEENIRKDKEKALEKSMANNNNDNSHVGSQCRRRNGRGWRCSQRTLVGYSLCEHHLGKGRLKSINTENGIVFINNNKKGSKFKKLPVLDASSYCKVTLDQHDQKSQKNDA